MYLQLILTHRRDDGTLDHERKQSARLERFPVSVGGGATDDFVVAELPAAAFVIAGPTSPGAAITLKSLAPDVVLQRLHTPLAAGAALRNGDELDIGERLHVRVVVGFTDTQQRGHVQLVATLAMVGVALVMLAQVVYMIAVNRDTSVDTVLAEELQRQKVYYLLDSLRSGTEVHLGNGDWPADTEKGMTGQVIAAELERLAFHLREHGDAMSMEQLTRCYDDLERLHEAYSALNDGTFTPPTPQVDTEAALSDITHRDRPHER
jgi:hypothetical protein